METAKDNNDIIPKSLNPQSETHNDNHNTTSLSKFDVKCQKCGETRNMEWKPGIHCPICGTTSLIPVIKIDSSQEKNKSNKLTETEKHQNVKVNIQYSGIKKYILIIISIFLILLFYKKGFFFSHDKQNAQITAKNLYWEYSCANCGKDFFALPRLNPVICPSCKSKTTNVYFVCLDCNHKFIITDKTKPLVCPKCSSKRIITYRDKQK